METKINQLELITKKQVKVYLIILLKQILFRILKIIIKVLVIQVDFLQVNLMMFQTITYLIKVNKIVIICLITKVLIKTTLSLIRIRTNKINNRTRQIRTNQINNKIRQIKTNQINNRTSKIKIVFLIINHLLVIRQIIIY